MIYQVFPFSHRSSRDHSQVMLVNTGKKHHTFLAEMDFTISF